MARWAPLRLLLFLLAFLRRRLFVRLWPELTPSPKHVDPGVSNFRHRSNSHPFRRRLGLIFRSAANMARSPTTPSPSPTTTISATTSTALEERIAILDDPVYAVADGHVLLAREGGPGWGNVIIVLHAYQENGVRNYVQSYYAHVEKMLVQAGA